MIILEQYMCTHVSTGCKTIMPNLHPENLLLKPAYLCGALDSCSCVLISSKLDRKSDSIIRKIIVRKKNQLEMTCYVMTSVQETKCCHVTWDSWRVSSFSIC